MRIRVFSCICLALVLLVVAAACAPAPAVPTSTPRPKLPSMPPTASPSSSASKSPSPTLPDKLQVVGAITLRVLPGIGHSPQALAVLDTRVYVVNRSSDNVSVIEGDNVVAVIPVGKMPDAVAADPKTGLVYVSNEGDNSISVISGERVVKTVPAPPSPACLAALEGRLYVGGRGESALAVLDGISGERIATVHLRTTMGILALAVSPVTHLLYASVYDAVEIVDLATLKVVGRLKHDVYLTLGADPTQERFFISEYEPDFNTQYLVAYDALGRNRLGRVLIGGDPRGMAVDPTSGHIYVANSWTNDVSVIDGKAMQIITTVPVGLQPLDVAIGKDGHIYVTNSNSDNVAVLDAQSNRLLGVVPVSIMTRSMAVHPGTGQVYVACASTNSVLVLDNGRVVTEIPVGLHPTEVTLSPDGDTLFVLNYVDGNLMLLSTRDNRILKTGEVGWLPQGLAIAPEDDQIYVSDAVLDMNSQRLLRRTELMTIYRSTVKPIRVEVDSKAGRAYMIASNGVPGSNGGMIVYVVDLKSGKRIEGQVGDLSTIGLALDTEGQQIFSVATRFSYYSLIVDDARSLKRIATLGLPKFPAALAYNPKTHHVFVCLTYTQNPDVKPGPELWVLDSRGLGTVANIPLPGMASYGDEYVLAVDAQRGYVYVADARRGIVYVLRDMNLPIPPTPVPTLTPTPWPTLTPQPMPSPTAVAQTEPQCPRAPDPRFQALWTGERDLRFGLRCPIQELRGGLVAEQAFERGHMLWREADRTIFVFFNDGKWRSYPDRWQEGMPEYSCEASPPAGLVRPKRGFGLVWCKELGVKEGLGWATEDERGYSSEWQIFELGQLIRSGARPSIYALFSDATFREYPVQ